MSNKMAEGSGQEKSVSRINVYARQGMISSTWCHRHGGWCLRDVIDAVFSCKERRSLQVEDSMSWQEAKCYRGFLCSREALGAGVLWGRFWWCLLRGSFGRGWRVVVSSGGSGLSGEGVQETFGGG